MKLVIKGVHRYWFHETLIGIVQERTGWNPERAKSFLLKTEWLNFDHVEKASARDLIDRLEAAGFEIQLQESGSTISAAIAMSSDGEVAALKKSLAELTTRLARLEEVKGLDSSRTVKQNKIYQKIAAEAGSARPAAPTLPRQQVSEGSAESNIGKYWLSRIGIFTLALGVVLFISYSFQFIGAWGKILTGAAIGLLLAGAGNYLAVKEKYRRWAMALIGGGWAILYFTVYAAYQIPATRVISSPVLGFAWLVGVMAGSISQSLKFRSPALVFFSYFLGFVALTMVDVSFYTLLASFILGVSIIIVTREMGWTWLAFLGLAAVYLTHYFWLSPSLVPGAWLGYENIFDALLLPWTGEEWRIYPLMAAEKSMLHLAFLVLYWLLFTVIGFFRNQKEDSGNLAFWLLLANSFVFTSSFIHHLHVYHPDLKYIFPMVMGVVFLFLSFAEQGMKRGLLSDLYLAFSVSMFGLALPMYFDGPWVTYGWAAALVIFTWLGVRRGRKILYRMAWVLAGMVFLRLMNFDYRERDILFTAVLPVRACLPVFLSSSLAFIAAYGICRSRELSPEKEKRIAENSLVIASALALAWAVLFGGFRPAASVVWAGEAVVLMSLGIYAKRVSLRFAAMAFAAFAALRIAAVDCGLEILKIFSAPRVSLRLAAVAWAIFALLALGHRLRKKCAPLEKREKIFSGALTTGGALLVLCYFYDQGISSWVSIVWGTAALAFIVGGFAFKDRLYRWCGLGIFTLVLLRLFFHDFSKLETIYRIISFIGLGGVFIAASFLYSYYSRLLLKDGET